MPSDRMIVLVYFSKQREDANVHSAYWSVRHESHHVVNTASNDDTSVLLWNAFMNANKLKLCGSLCDFELRPDYKKNLLKGTYFSSIY